MRGDVVDLTGRRHVDQVVGLDLDLVARRKEGVEAHDEVGVAFEELRHSADNAGRVDASTTNRREQSVQTLLCRGSHTGTSRSCLTFGT